MARQASGEFAWGDLIYDWNTREPGSRPEPSLFEILDETLRDGLQNPSVKDPCLDDKIELVGRMEALGIHVVNTGLPSASPRAFDDVLGICRAIRDSGMRIRPAAAGRTLVADVTPIIEISQRLGMSIETNVFIGSSPVRQLTEDWELPAMIRRSAEAIDAVVRAGLPATFVTEDATRSRPDVLSALFRNAVEHGATRVCLADTVGHATPIGIESLVRFTRKTLDEAGAGAVGIDFHGHDDRGLALANSLMALRCGVNRVHATALGIGERVGNTPMEQLLVNLKLSGQLEGQDVSAMPEYSRAAARMLAWSIPVDYPVVGRDAFRTASGVHASAIVKAQIKGQSWLADLVYSSIPASAFGRRQEIEIGYMSGASNVIYWLRERKLEAQPELVSAILLAAKKADHSLTEPEVMALIEAWQRSK